jgi:hypothetical protein
LDLQISLNEIELIGDHARHGVSPDWCRHQPRATSVIGKNGKPQVYGTRHGKDRYSEGSHCPLQWGNPSLEGIALARAAYVVWHRCLDRLVLTLTEKLKYHAATPAVAPSAPWTLPR